MTARKHDLLQLNILFVQISSLKEKKKKKMTEIGTTIFSQIKVHLEQGIPLSICYWQLS